VYGSLYSRTKVCCTLLFHPHHSHLRVEIEGAKAIVSCSVDSPRDYDVSVLNDSHVEKIHYELTPTRIEWGIGATELECVIRRDVAPIETGVCRRYDEAVEVDERAILKVGRKYIDIDVIWLRTYMDIVYVCYIVEP
jgi:hypothetical protein